MKCCRNNAMSLKIESLAPMSLDPPHSWIRPVDKARDEFYHHRSGLWVHAVSVLPSTLRDTIRVTTRSFRGEHWQGPTLPRVDVDRCQAIYGIWEFLMAHRVNQIGVAINIVSQSRVPLSAHTSTNGYIPI
jgi:hypothetical protein